MVLDTPPVSICRLLRILPTRVALTETIKESKRCSVFLLALRQIGHSLGLRCMMISRHSSQSTAWRQGMSSTLRGCVRHITHKRSSSRAGSMEFTNLLRIQTAADAGLGNIFCSLCVEDATRSRTFRARGCSSNSFAACSGLRRELHLQGL